MKNCTPLWREAHLQVKKLKAPHVRTTFGEQVHAFVARSTFPSQNVKKNQGVGRRCDVGKVHGAVARSTFRSQNVQSTPCSMLGPLLEVEMSKKCTPLWREAQFEAKMLKAPHVRSTFGS